MKVKHGTMLLVALTAIEIFLPRRRLILIVPADALRMINLDVPQMAIQGDTIQLSCSYALVADGDQRQDIVAVTRYELDESVDANNRLSASRKLANLTNQLSLSRRSSRGNEPTYRLSSDLRQVELLYAIKWYKNEREFFRYVTQDWPHKQVLPMDGLNIDAEKSDNQTVVLRNVSLNTSGLFRCEVSTDAPSFLTKSIERKVVVYSLPTEGPTIELPGGLARQIYYLGSQLELTCVSRESKPPIQLDWILNEQINLTSGMPHNSQDEPVFQVANTRIIRLPNASVGHQVNTNNLGISLARDSYTTFALDPASVNGATIVARSMPTNAHSPQTVTLNVDNLHQLAEITMSRLNFTIDTNLVKSISQFSNIGEQARRVASLNWRTRKTNQEVAGKIGISSLASESSITKLPLRVRCVARVLHLKMSDDIKLIIVNKTKASVVSGELEPTHSQRRDNGPANSATRLDILQCWMIAIICALVASRYSIIVCNI